MDEKGRCWSKGNYQVDIYSPGNKLKKYIQVVI